MFRLKMLALLAVLFAACAGAGAAEDALVELPEQVEMFFVYEEVCASCDGTEEFFKLVSEHLGGGVGETYPYTIFTINTFRGGGQQQFEALSYDLLGVDAATLRLPVLIVNGIAYEGLEYIGRNLREAYLTAGSDLFGRGHIFNPRYMLSGAELFAEYHAKPQHLSLVYFYRLVCPACIEIEPLLSDLPDSVYIDGRNVAVDLIRINTRSGNNRDRVLTFFEAYDVPSEERIVPIIFTAAGHFSGTDAIVELIASLEARGADMLNFKFPAG